LLQKGDLHKKGFSPTPFSEDASKDGTFCYKHSKDLQLIKTQKYIIRRRNLLQGSLELHQREK
jgi:hypothetical protein